MHDHQMFKQRCRPIRFVASPGCVIIALLGYIGGGGGVAAAASPLPAFSQTAPMGERDLAAAPRLQETCSLDSVSTPLVEVLDHLSRESGIDLTAENFPRTLRYQRITLIVRDEPLWRVMSRIVLLLSHGDSRRRQYYWLPGPATQGGDRPAYRLVRDAAARLAEREELEKPYKDALSTLKEIRRLARLPAEKRETVSNILPGEFIDRLDSIPEAQAVKGLSDVQLNALLDGESIFLPAEGLRQSLKEQYDRVVARYVSQGDPRTFPPFQMNAEWMTLQANHSFFNEDPARRVTYMLQVVPGKVSGPSNGGMHLNGPLKSDEAGLLDESADNGAPVFDLSPILDARGVTAQQRDDLAFTLSALARVARVNLYQEHFLKSSAEGTGLKLRRGTLPQLLNAICRTWKWRIEKQGNDYLLWSRTWAQDRLADIEEPTLDQWRRRITANGSRVSVWDQLEMAQEFTWPQFKCTLPAAIPEVTSDVTRRGYLSMRVVGKMTAMERTASMRPGGIPVSALSLSVQRAISQELDYQIVYQVLRPGMPITDINERVRRGSLALAKRQRTANDPTDFAPSSLRLVDRRGEVLWQQISGF